MPSVLMGVFALALMSAPADGSPRARYEALAGEFEAAETAAIAEHSRAATDEGRSAALLKRPRPDEFAPRFLALAGEAPGDPAAIDALTWVAMRCLYAPPGERALAILARDHSRSDRLKDYCGQDSLYGEPYAPYEGFLRAVLRDNPDREVRGRACLALAGHLKMAKEATASSLVGGTHLRNPTAATRANFERIRSRGLDAVAAESAALFEEVIAKYADLAIATNFPANAGEFARGQLFELRNLVIGARAPEIEGRDAQGRPLKLSDYRGRVVVLDFGSHRSCGVCRLMYPALRDFVRDYRDKPVALLGISVDDKAEELRAVAERGETTWPIWSDGEDLAGPIAARWVVRSMPTFYILDRQGVIRNKGFLQADQIRSTVDALLREVDPIRDAVGVIIPVALPR